MVWLMVPSLPALVYPTVLGTGWIVALQQLPRREIIGSLARIVVANTKKVSSEHQRRASRAVRS
jgi:hypothetical protein